MDHLYDRSNEALKNRPAPWGSTTEYSLRSGRSKTVFLFIHGLYMGPAMWDLQTQYASEIGANSMTLALAGHGDQSSEARRVSYKDWIEETRRAIKLAHALGDKVILVGHSTGAILGVGQALEDPHAVDALVLLEPAVEVLGYIALGSCLGKYFLDSPNDDPALMRLAGYDPCLPTRVSLNMGCEVTKIRNQLLTDYLKMGPAEDTDVYGAPISPGEKSKELGALLRVPTFMVNNPTDNAVSSYSNRQFAKGLVSNPEGHFEEIPRGDPHGQLTFNHPEQIQKGIDDLISKDLYMGQVLRLGKFQMTELKNLKFLEYTLNNLDSAPTNMTDIGNACGSVSDRIPHCLSFFQDQLKAESAEPEAAILKKQQRQEFHESLVSLYMEIYKLPN